MKFASTLAAAALAAALVACSPAGSSQPAPAASQSAVVGDAAAILAAHGLDGLTPEQLVDQLDASQEDRTAGPMGSVRPNELLISDGQTQASIPLPADKFYLAIAPYLTTTHDCFNHNLATCQGELAEQTIAVKIVDDAGTTLVDDDVTTYANGFAGFWLPAGITGTLSVEYQGRTVTAPFGTGADDPTCVTTLQLG